MYCIKCGCKLPEGAAFCPACGNKLGKEEKPEKPGRKVNLRIIIPAALVLLLAALIFSIPAFTGGKNVGATENAPETENQDLETAERALLPEPVETKMPEPVEEVLSLYVPKVKDTMGSQSFEGSGLLYDLNGDGCRELIILYADNVGWEYNYLAGIYGQKNGELHPILETLVLSPVGEGSQASAGVAEYMGRLYFVATGSSPSETDEGCLEERTRLFDTADGSLFLEICGSYGVDENNMPLSLDSCSINGESCTPEERDEALASIETLSFLSQEGPGDEGLPLHKLILSLGGESLEEYSAGDNSSAEVPVSPAAAKSAAQTFLAYKPETDSNGNQLLLLNSGLVDGSQGDQYYRIRMGWWITDDEYPGAGYFSNMMTVYVNAQTGVCEAYLP